MLTKKRKLEMTTGVFSVAMGIFLIIQLAYNGAYKDLASILVGIAFILTLLVVWAGNKFA